MPRPLVPLGRLALAAALLSLVACGGGTPVDAEPASEAVRRVALSVAADGSDVLTRFDAGETVEASSDPQSERLAGIAPKPPIVDAASGIEVRRDPGKLSIQYEGGTPSQRWARIDADPVTPGNQVLWTGLREANVPDSEGNPAKARVQVNAYSAELVRAREVAMRIRVFVPKDVDLLRSMPSTFDWLTISEWWNNAPWTGQPWPFRISVNITKPSATRGTPLYFAVSAEALDPGTGTWIQGVWGRVNRQFAVPTGRWLTFDYFVREGKARTGRFYLAVTPDGGKPTVLFNVTGWTHHPSDPAPDGLTHFNPMKLYTSRAVVDHVVQSGGLLQLAWDDPAFRFCAETVAGQPSPCAPDGVD